MGKCGLILVLVLLASPAEAQRVVTDGPANVNRAEVRSRRRERNPYFAARPIYPPAPRGARSNVTFAPFTSKYYPTENSYYPPLPVYPTTRRR